jgi:hypothetical protein
MYASSKCIIQCKALQTNTALASLASSDASVCIYPGCVQESTGKLKKEGWGGSLKWQIKCSMHVVLLGSLL